MILLKTVVANNNFSATNILDDLENWLIENNIGNDVYEDMLGILLEKGITGSLLIKFYDTICLADIYNLYKNTFILENGNYERNEIISNLEQEVPLNFINDNIKLEGFQDYKLSLHLTDEKFIEYSNIQHDNFKTRLKESGINSFQANM